MSEPNPPAPDANEPPPVPAPEPAEPPLVTRPDQGADAPGAPEHAPPAPRRPRPGLWEAVAWCVVFVLAQMFGAVVAVTVAFTAHALSAQNPKQFVDEQLEGFSKAVDPKAEGERPPMPAAFGQALAWGMLVAQFVSLGLIAVVFPRRIGPDWKRQLGVRRPHGLHVALVLLIVPGFIIVSGVILELYQWATGIRPAPAAESLKGVFGVFPWPLTVLAVAVGPGVVEELWCRGFLGRGLCARYGLVVGVLVTSVLFAAMHVDPSQLGGIVVMGAYLHFVYLASRSIWVPVLLHMMNNGLAILLTLGLKPEQLNQTNQVPLVVSLAALSLMIFGSVALWTSRAKLEPVSGDDPTWYDDTEWQSGWQPEYPGISAPPPEADVRLGYATVSPVALIFTVASFGILCYLAYRYIF